MKIEIIVVALLATIGLGVLIAAVVNALSTWMGLQ